MNLHFLVLIYVFLKHVFSAQWRVPPFMMRQMFEIIVVYFEYFQKPSKFNVVNQQKSTGVTLHSD